ncbi:unnamed protein product, partial [Ectocarpus sp. 6 AP-2014]
MSAAAAAAAAPPSTNRGGTVDSSSSSSRGGAGRAPCLRPRRLPRRGTGSAAGFLPARQVEGLYLGHQVLDPPLTEDLGGHCAVRALQERHHLVHRVAPPPL